LSVTSVLAALQERQAGGVSLAFPKDRLRLHAMVTSAGYDRCTDPTYDWHGLKRGESPFVLLQHTIAGQGQLRFEGRRLQLHPGDTMLLTFPHDNRYWLGRGDSWEFFWIILNGREIMRLWQEFLASGPVARLPPEGVERIAATCLAVLEGEAATPAQASALAYGVAMELADRLTGSGGGRAAGATRPDGIERALSLCHGHPGEPLDVARLARASGYSRYHFSRLFAEHEGVSPARYLMRLRMEEASRLLRLEDVPVKAVAHRCGFDDANYFAKVFRRFYGIAPTDFRRSGMFSGRPGETG